METNIVDLFKAFQAEAMKLHPGCNVSAHITNLSFAAVEANPSDDEDSPISAHHVDARMLNSGTYISSNPCPGLDLESKRV